GHFQHGWIECAGALAPPRDFVPICERLWRSALHTRIKERRCIRQIAPTTHHSDNALRPAHAACQLVRPYSDKAIGHVGTDRPRQSPNPPQRPHATRETLAPNWYFARTETSPRSCRVRRPAD